MNNSTLKDISILYVESANGARESLLALLKKLFKDIFVAKNATQGRSLFDKLKDSNINIDIVIGDIDTLTKIREVDKEVYLMVTITHTEPSFFINAIELGVKYCAVKPFDMVKIITAIENICELKQAQKLQEKEDKDNSRYIDIINKVALVSKTDLGGNITFVNDIFCEISGYTRDELIGTNQRIVRHPDMDKVIFDDLWNALRAGKTWRHKLKNKAKNGEPYMINATIFPVYDEETNEVIEYMAVRFMITEDEIKKRNFQKNVITNIKKQKQKEMELKNKVKELERSLKFMGASDVASLQEALTDQREKLLKAKKQVFYYEDKLKYEQSENKQLSQVIDQKRTDLVKLSKESKESARKHQDELTELQLKSIKQTTEVQKLTTMSEEQTNTIMNLRNTIRELKQN